MKPLQLRLHSYQHQQEAKELQGKLQAPVSGNAVSSIDAQLGDARDARADAEAQLSKAQSQLDAMTVLSDSRRNCGRSQPQCF